MEKRKSRLLAPEQDKQNTDAIVDAVTAKLQTHTTEPRTRRNALKYGLAGVGALAAYLVGQGIPPAQAARIATGYIDQIGRIDLDLGTAPSTPASGVLSLYAKSTDKRPYAKDDAGNEISLDATGHAALTTGIHGVGAGTVAKVGDIATDANLSAAAQAAVAASHAAVTLSTELDAILALSTQALDLDTQAANTVLAGPATGAAAKPTARALVVADIPSHGSSKHTAVHRYITNVDLQFRPMATSSFGVAGLCFMGYLVIPFECTIDQIIYCVGDVSAGNVRAGLYGPITAGTPPEAPDGAALVIESASVAQIAALSTQHVDITATAITTPGIYWAAVQGSDATGTIYRVNLASTGGIHGHGYTRAGGYGAFTNPCPSTGNDMMLMCGVRVKSLP